jgi:hypothetical protein
MDINAIIPDEGILPEEWFLDIEIQAFMAG